MADDFVTDPEYEHLGAAKEHLCQALTEHEKRCAEGPSCTYKPGVIAWLAIQWGFTRAELRQLDEYVENELRELELRDQEERRRA